MNIPEPRDWQRDYWRAHRTDPNRALWASPRLGKTMAEAVGMRGAFDYFDTRRGLVSAPLRVLPIWRDWLIRCDLDPIDGYSMPTAQVADLLKRKPNGVLLLNHDRLGNVRRSASGNPTKRAALLDPMLRWLGGGCFIADEAHMLSTPSSNRGRASRRLAAAAAWVRTLTGTPAPNHLGNVWGQLVGLDANAFGTYGDFKARFLIVNPRFESQVIGYRNIDELRALLLNYVTLVRREDVFGPDHWQEVIRELELPPAARALYDRLARDWMLEELNLNTTNILSRMTRFQQLTSGFLPDASMGEGGLREIHRAKINAILGDLGEPMAAGQKAVIFHRFLWEAAELRKELTSWGVAVYKIDGTVGAAETASIVANFRIIPRPTVVTIQLQAGGSGLDLSEADHVLFASESFSFVDFEQARDRAFKPGKPRVVGRYHMRDTVDEYIMDLLSRKQNLHNALRHADKERMVFGRATRRKSIA
jgi:hypothetical protein